MTQPIAFAADTVFDGHSATTDRAVVVEDGRITAMLPRSDVPADLERVELPDGAWLAPGFIDVQVNGGGDVLFNDQPTPEGIAAIADAHARYGTTGLMPTLISESSETMRSGLAAVQAVVGRDPRILGIHFEGPLLSPKRPGVHDPAMIRKPLPGDIEIFTGLSGGVTVVTLAPEEVGPAFVRRLAGAGVRVSLGHSMATYAETRAAIAEGLCCFTHLFNAMPPLMAREPGPAAAALENADVWYGIIADGIHVDPAMLRLAFRNPGRAMLVTDAMPCVGGSATSFRLYGNDISVRDGRCVRSDGTLAGAALDMGTAVANCIGRLGLLPERALCAASAEPADFLGLGHERGRLQAGHRADMVGLDPQGWRVIGTWIGGRQVGPG